MHTFEAKKSTCSMFFLPSSTWLLQKKKIVIKKIYNAKIVKFSNNSLTESCYCVLMIYIHEYYKEIHNNINGGSL